MTFSKKKYGFPVVTFFIILFISLNAIVYLYTLSPVDNYFTSEDGDVQFLIFLESQEPSIPQDSNKQYQDSYIQHYEQNQLQQQKVVKSRPFETLLEAHKNSVILQSLRNQLRVENFLNMLNPSNKNKQSSSENQKNSNDDKQKTFATDSKEQNVARDLEAANNIIFKRGQIPLI